MHICVRLDHSKLCLFASGELFTSEGITIVSNFELSRIDSDDRSDEKLTKSDTWLGNSLQELARVFQIILQHKGETKLEERNCDFLWAGLPYQCCCH